jgi:hypothetical protein
LFLALLKNVILDIVEF